MKPAWPVPSSFSVPRSIFRSLGAAVVALIILLPKTTQAEAVEDYERMGEYEEDGQRFGAVLVNGALLPTANAPGGWSLVRTYENKSDAPVEVTLEERIESTESAYGARVTDLPIVRLSRTQKLRLGANEKKSIGTYLPEKLGQAMTKAHHNEAMSKAQMEAGRYDNPISYSYYSVKYLRPLAPGETAAAPMRPSIDGEITAEMPKYAEPAATNAPRPPRPSSKAKLVRDVGF